MRRTRTLQATNTLVSSGCVERVDPKHGVVMFHVSMAMIRNIHGRRVLVVDAQPDTTATLSVLFIKLGYETRCTHRGREANRLARDFDPDVILLDPCLPDLSGYEVVRALRANPSRPDRYIAAISGRSQAGDLERIKRAGFDRFLVKPIDIAKLREMVGAIGEHRRRFVN